MKPIHTMLLSASITLSVVFLYKKIIQNFDAPEIEDVEVMEEFTEDIIEEVLEPEVEWRSYRVQKGDTLGKILPEFGLSTNQIRNAALAIYDLANLRIDQEFRFQYPPGAESPNEVRYPLGEDDTLVIRQTDDGWQAEREKINFDIIIGYRHFVVNSSLWNAAIEGGLKPSDIAQMAEVLQYDLDFNTEIKKGATAELLVEELWQDGQLMKLGKPLILIFTNNEKEYQAIRFTNSNDVSAYYDSDGISRESPFLRSPLAFSRVTSNFNPKRYHPVLKKPRPHNGTDFGAQTGTHVRTVANGVVTYAGINGGHGNFVKIKHQDGFETSYSHLSKITVKKGQQVKKGQHIGNVGSTGLSTGPHLHYQVWQNNRYVDAMKVQFPKGRKLSGADLSNFKQQRSELWAQFEEQKKSSNTTQNLSVQE